MNSRLLNQVFPTKARVSDATLAFKRSINPMPELTIRITLSENVDPQKLGLSIAIFVRSITPPDQLRAITDEMIQQLLSQGITVENSSLFS